MSHIVVHPRILMVDNDKRAIEALTALLSKALPNAYVADDVTDGTKALSLCRAYGNQRHHIARHVARGLAGTRHLQTYTPHQQ